MLVSQHLPSSCCNRILHQLIEFISLPKIKAMFNSATDVVRIVCSLDSLQYHHRENEKSLAIPLPLDTPIH
eukprot:11057320-Ditylum_brightwellii.AAC.1